MTEDDNLLTRRQLIGLFGGVGVAIGMASGLQGVGSGQGNLNAGRMALTEAFKAGDNLWHGPLSARGDVPQRDGVAYIQTDAGANNDKYKIFHYDGGWVARGLDTPAITTEDLNNVRYIATSEDPQAVVNDEGADTLFVISPGTHTFERDGTGSIVETTAAGQVFHITEGATVKLGDNEIDDANRANLFKLAHNRCGIIGEGIIDWNKGGGNGGSFSTLSTDNAAILVDGQVEDIVFKDITIQNVDAVPIWIQGAGAASRADNIRILNLDMFDVGKGPIWNDADHIKCIGNYIDTVTASAATENGIEAGDNTDYWTIRDNTVIDCDHAGIYIKESTATKGAIEGNQLLRCGITKSAAGMEIGATSAVEYIRISSNTIEDSGAQGINYQGAAYKAVIRDNDIIKPAGTAIQLGSTARVFGNYIENDAGTGIFVGVGADRTKVLGNTINASNSNDGIQNSGGTFVLIADNTLRNCRKGVWVSSGQATSLRDNIYESCTTDIDNDVAGTLRNGIGSGGYSGDGTTGRTISLGYRPSVVWVEGSDGTLYEVRDDNLSVVDGAAPTGELSIANDGFTVGDNSADADPNTNGENYQFQTRVTL